MKYLSIPIVGFICALVLLLVGGTSVKAATFDIAPGDVYGEQGLISAINQANANGEDDIINLSENSEYVLTYTYNPEVSWDPYQSYPSGTPVITTSITINGNGSVVRRDQNVEDKFRIFTITYGRLIIDNLKVTGGHVPNGWNGGGIFNGLSAGQLVVKNSIVENNTASQGGGIATLWSDVRVENSQIINNHAITEYPQYSVGGGISTSAYNSSNLHIDIIDSIISGNTATLGGGIYSGVSRLSLTGNTFENNQGSWKGGALYFATFYNEGTLLATGNTFNNNSGAAMYLTNVLSGTVSDNRFGDNYGVSIYTDWQPNGAGVAYEPLEIHGNCFQSGVYSGDYYLTMNAQNNWWGDASGPSGLGTGTGTYITGYNANFTPFLTTGCPLDHVNQAPTVEINGSYSVVEGNSVELSATGFDADNDTLTYEWDLNNDGIFETAGQTVTFSSVGLVAPTTQAVKVRVSDGNLTAEAEGSVLVVFNFTGFTAGIDQFPRINQVLFGSDVVFKFRLNGDHGMNVIEAGYPKSEQITCGSDVEVFGTDSTLSNNQGLTYHPNTDNYKYVWKTDPSWKGTS